MRVALMLAVMLGMVGGAVAQDNARGVRDASLQASRYELLLGKLQGQNEDLMGQVRALQKANDLLAKDVQASSAKAQNVADELQRMKNTQLQNISASQKQLSDQVAAVSTKSQGAWGDGQRDCSELGVKHQQLKVMLKPDGTKGMRFLCFDGKALHLGTEIYTPAE